MRKAKTGSKKHQDKVVKLTQELQRLNSKKPLGARVGVCVDVEAFGSNKDTGSPDDSGFDDSDITDNEDSLTLLGSDGGMGKKGKKKTAQGKGGAWYKDVRVRARARARVWG